MAFCDWGGASRSTSTSVSPVMVSGIVTSCRPSAPAIRTKSPSKAVKVAVPFSSVWVWTDHRWVPLPSQTDSSTTGWEVVALVTFTVRLRLVPDSKSVKKYALVLWRSVSMKSGSSPNRRPAPRSCTE